MLLCEDSSWNLLVMLYELFRKTTIFHCNIFGTSSFDLNKRFHLASYFHIYQTERNEQINVDFGKMLAKK